MIIAFSRDSHDRMLGMIRSLKDAFVQVDIVSRYFELIGPSTGISTVEGVPVLCLPPRALGTSAKLLKRAMDIVVALLALLVLTARSFSWSRLLIKLDSRGPVFFRQPRIGAGGREFRIVKFRTMVRDADEQKQERRAPEQARARDERMFKIARRPACHARRSPSSGAPRSTSCRSSSTCCAGR